MTALLSTAECDKKQKYLQVSQDCRATFTPLCMSVDGMLGCKATAFLKWIGDMLTPKWEMDYGTVMGRFILGYCLQSFMLHCCVFGGLILSGMHLA